MVQDLNNQQSTVNSQQSTINNQQSTNMERGLMWLPLLAIFIGLAWAGWNEYKKLEAYGVWAQKFDRAKYDIYAVLGQQEDCLTWGKPTRSGPVNLQTFSLKDVESLELMVNGAAVDLENPPSAGSAIVLEFMLKDAEAVQVPFTEIPLAIKWCQHLQQELQRFL